MKDTIDITRTLNIHPGNMAKYVQYFAASLQQELGIVWGWKAPCLIEFQAPSGVAKGTSGSLGYKGSTINLKVKLPFMLAAMSTQIERKINERLASVETMAASAMEGKVPA